MLTEKYLIINNSKQQYVVIVQCTARTVEDYINYGKKATTFPDGSLNFAAMTNWLISRNLKHRMYIGKEKRLLIRFYIHRDIIIANRIAKNHGLLLSDQKINEDLDTLDNSHTTKADLLWDFS